VSYVVTLLGCNSVMV